MVLKIWFVRYGIFVIVISDNGLFFNSGDFELFSKEWDFYYIILSFCYFQSNGCVENVVKFCKLLLMKVCVDK